MTYSLSFPILIQLLGCNIGGNEPPRFKSFNGEEVKYLFGIAYIQSYIFEGNTVYPGTRWDIDIEVSDSNGDDVEILFPSAPGVFEFNQETQSGYWEIPVTVPDTYPTVQILAVDEHGASDILVLNLEIHQDWDSGLWDTGWWDDTNYGGPGSNDSPFLTGDMNIENGFVGTIEYRNPRTQCRIQWNRLEGESIENCDWCEHTWQFSLAQGSIATRDGSCDGDTLVLESQDWRIGWATSTTWNELDFENTVLLDHPDAGWTPMGQGTLIGNRFDFTVSIP